MHYVAGAFLLAQVALIWVVRDSADVPGLEYVGWAVWSVGIILLALSIRALRSRGGAQEGRSYVETERLIETGVYALVRHPLYLGWMLMYPALLLFEPNWMQAILAVLGTTCVHLFTVQEERRLIDKFGESYKDYMQAVPRFNLLTSVIRLLLKRHSANRGTP